MAVRRTADAAQSRRTVNDEGGWRTMGNRLLRRLLPGALAALALAAMPAAASASGSLLDSCPTRTIEHPFTRWLDWSSYTLVPGGTIEGSLSGWKLTGGATVVTGNESFNVHGAGETHALKLPSGSSATTPPMCVAVLDPTLRYFAANDGGLLSLLTVQMLYYPPGGGVITLPLGVNVGGKAWAPSLPMIVAADLLGVLNGGQAQVAFRFTPTGLGASWRIDDVYVDPYSAR
jgi:hypothetical protein